MNVQQPQVLLLALEITDYQSAEEMFLKSLKVLKKRCEMSEPLSVCPPKREDLVKVLAQISFCWEFVFVDYVSH